LLDRSSAVINLDPSFNLKRDHKATFRDESGNRSDAQLRALEETGHWVLGPRASRGGAAPDVFAGSLSIHDWEPHHDVGGLLHILCDLPGFQAGSRVNRELLLMQSYRKY
jgi:hypothetical protein